MDEKKEYIERGALLEKNMYGNTAPITHRTYAEMLIQSAPAADVVKVVRCKDCVWWEIRGLPGTVGRCENPHNGLWNEYTYACDYCSYGERKEE